MVRLLSVILVLMAGPVFAQDRAQTLADIRQDLTVLFVELQGLRRELSTTGGSGVTLQGTNILDRVNALEAEVQRLTSETERLTNRVDTVVRDGTNRVGDLEFRLCELEPACDIASLGDTPTLGGGALPQVAAPAPSSSPSPGTGTGTGTGALPGIGGVELAVAEREDFERARSAFDEGNFEVAAERFQSFTDTYQGGPLTGLAHLLRGEALQNLGRTSSAARAFLQSYSGSPDAATAPVALLRLGLALDGLGQSSEACITLGEVTTRFPASEASIEAQAARAGIGCT